MCESYVRLQCDPDRPKGFHGEITLNALRDISVSNVSGSAQKVRRRKTDISRSSDAFFLLSLQIEGGCTVEQRAGLADLAVGDFALYSSIEPYCLHLPDHFRQLVLQIPRDALLERLPNADQLTATRVAGSEKTAAAVQSSLLGMAACIKQADPVVRACLEQVLIDLVATGLATRSGDGAHLKAHEQTLLIRARNYIAENLSDPDLNRYRVADAAGVSVRRLNEVFQKQDQSISLAIRAARLNRIAADLRDPRFNHDSVSTIALRRGIRNLNHFSQSFRKNFDVTPREYRRQNWLRASVVAAVDARRI
ncbi:helix-turn-helix domain-containing protein [Nitratireductor sp. XY-223]|uniref:AraC-like ligand-binding domain-containing protein n=1 Tax=Nitratireductor sp. XY-223 TaxID=2561926 RepID=UPI0010AA2397|nr:helix-turn-helix domain-containing protein [Nitratireductor sp. XY-223]